MLLWVFLSGNPLDYNYTPMPDNKLLIFENTVLFAPEGVDGGFYFELDTEGKIYCYDKKVADNGHYNPRTYNLEYGTLGEIKNYLYNLKQNTDFNNLPICIDNDSRDGCSNHFYFDGVDIYCNNIYYSDDEDFKNPKYEKFWDIMRQQNMVLDAYTDIQNIFKAAGYELNAYEFYKIKAPYNVFSFKMRSYFYREDGPIGFNISLYSDGKIEESQIYGNGEYRNTQTYNIAPEYAEEVEALINQYDLYGIPKYINNETFDGASYTFEFLDKKISCDNIYYTDEEDLKDYSGEYLLAMQQQNLVLDLFNGIQNIFARAHFELSLYDFMAVD